MGKQVKVGKSILSAIHDATDNDMIVWPRLRDWLEAHGDDPLRPDVAQWVVAQLTKAKRYRGSSFGGSAAGKCDRAQIFGYMDAVIPEDTEAQLQQIFADGSWRHLRLQAQMVMAGILELDDLEFWAPWHIMNAKGSVDGVGIVPDTHARRDWHGKTFGLEIKGSNHWVAAKMDHPTKFTKQVHRYFLTAGFDLFVIYVEDKSSQEVKEWVIEPDPVLIQEQRDELERLNRYVIKKRLPPRLHECEGGSGTTFRQCPFGTTGTRPCMASESWSDVPVRNRLPIAPAKKVPRRRRAT